MKILAGIITYNPDIERLRENFDAIVNQVEKVVLIDNDSTNIADLENFLKSYPQVALIKNNDNLGVARALNQEMEYAEANGYDWVLALDQDSVAPKGMTDEYKKYVGKNDLGMITCKTQDRSVFVKENKKTRIEGEYITQCITSGTLTRVSAWRNVGGYYEPLFIDDVDNDFCDSLCEKGWKIWCTYNIRLLHEIGKNLKRVKVCNVTRDVYNHSAFRYYYIVRNYLVRGKRRKNMKFAVKEVLRRIYITNRYEYDCWNKNKMMLLGIWHFLIGRYGKL